MVEPIPHRHNGRFDLSGKVAVVTGSGRGLGRVMAVGLAEAGAAVVTCARTFDEAEETAAAISAAGGTAVGRQVDVTDPDSCARLIAGAAAHFGRLDVLVNNAGVEIVQPAADLRVADWQQMLATNLTGTFTCARLAAAQMRGQVEGGSIINVSSISSTIGMPGHAGYGTAKGGVNQLTRTLALEWAPDRIRVNALAPGYMDNRMRGGGLTDLERVQALTPMGRRGRPEELVGPLIFLASAASSYVTGVVLYVDGGTTAV